MKRVTYIKLILVFIISLANFWIWRIFSQSLLLGLLLILISVLLVFRIKILTLVLVILLGFVLIKTNLDTNLLKVSPLENDQLVYRFEYYAQGFGKLYMNRIGLYLNYKLLPSLSKYQRNLAYNLDPNLYFFANHPRERAGIIEFGKFPAITLPFFLFGIGLLLSGGFSFLVLYFVIAEFLSAFILPEYVLGPILIFPFVIGVLFLTFSRILNVKYEN